MNLFEFPSRVKTENRSIKVKTCLRKFIEESQKKIKEMVRTGCEQRINLSTFATIVSIDTKECRELRSDMVIWK